MRLHPVCSAAVVMLLTLTAAHSARTLPADVLPLGGTWGFRLDPTDVGIRHAWWRARLPESVRLPGSTDENRKGTLNDSPPGFEYLRRVYRYAGAAWYQREVTVPTAWRGRRITLSLERCHWESRAWLDDTPLGMRDSLSVPHIYDLGTGVAPGRHRLTLRVDNTLKYDMGGAAHSTSEQTQTNWNGVVGRLELRATDPVWLDRVDIYPDARRRAARVRIMVGNATGRSARGSVAVTWGSAGSAGHRQAVRLPCVVPAGGGPLQTALALGPGAPKWDEFSPAVCRLAVEIGASAGTRRFRDRRVAAFGLRDLRVSRKRITLNDRCIFLRGTLECCIFPRTGYPPTDVASWSRIFRICRSYGLNHMRFHSWCPPEAAFVAADSAGVLLHIEAPCWVGNWGKDAPRDRWVGEEVRRILDAYGDHPSFGMLCMGNEPGGDYRVIHDLVRMARSYDPRHLYTAGAGWGAGPDDDYHVTPEGRGVRGPGTDHDNRDTVARHTAPIVEHEVGQWEVFPRLAEIPKYTGVLKPRNLEITRDALAARGLLPLAPAFTRASGRLSAELYKEEIEMLLRTPGQAGFALLDLHDFPGQGTSLVGMLDAFWDSKGIIAPAAFRQFCGPTVPLLRVPKRTYTTGERLVADVDLAHYGPYALRRAAAIWRIADDAGRLVAAGTLPPADVPTGQVTRLGRIDCPLARVRPPARVTVTVSLPGAGAGNAWHLWVYAGGPAPQPPSGVLVTRAYDDAAAALRSGRRVLLLAGADVLGRSLPGSFTTVFWNPIMFANQPGTMGILCDAAHPALAAFPTGEHTDWQWYDLLQRSRSMVLDDLPGPPDPIIRVIDNYARNHRLGALFEARVGAGSLLVCSLNLRGDLSGRPAAAQMLRSLYAYVASPAFRPTLGIGEAALARLFRSAPAFTRLTQAPDLSRAVLHVKAAVNVAVPEKPEPWQAAADQVIARGAGYDYTVRGGTWRDSVGAAWHDGADLGVRLTVPRGFHGTLHVFLWDWNRLNRVAELSFCRRDLGALEEYDGAGAWLAIPVTSEDSASGALELSVRPTTANAMISEIALVPAAGP